MQHSGGHINTQNNRANEKQGGNLNNSNNNSNNNNTSEHDDDDDDDNDNDDDNDIDDGPGETSSSPSRGGMPRMQKRDSYLADDLADFDPASLEADDDNDWRGIFDDDEGNNNRSGAAGGGGRGQSSSKRSSSSSSSSSDDGPLSSSAGALSSDRLDDLLDPISSARALMPPPPASSDNPGRSSSISSMRGMEELSSNRPMLDPSITRRILMSQNLDQIDSAPPTWHSDAADKHHRQEMVQDIAKLLYARKKGTVPDKSWLQRVPVKAKMLESKLYQSAASLEAYLNRATLKLRLGALASAITSYYKEALKGSKGTKRGSTVSIGSLASLEDAFSDSNLRRESSSSIASSLPIDFGRRESLLSNEEKGTSDIVSTLKQSNDSAVLNRSSLGNNIVIAGTDIVGSNRGNPDVKGAINNSMSTFLQRGQSDSSLLVSQANNRLSASIDAVSGMNCNTNLFMQNNNNINNSNAGFVGGMMNGTGGLSGSNSVDSMTGTSNAAASINGMTQQQQLFLASIRQQQQEVLNRRMGMGNFSMMTQQQGNYVLQQQQQQQQQQQNSLSMGLFQQQQQQQRTLILQQQMQQQQQLQKQRQQQQAFQNVPPNISMQNISIMQQQQHNSLMGMNTNNNNNNNNNISTGMTMMNNNSNLPTILPGMGNTNNVVGPTMMGGGNGMQVAAAAAAMMGGVGNGGMNNNNNVNVRGMNNNINGMMGQMNNISSINSSNNNRMPSLGLLPVPSLPRNSSMGGAGAGGGNHGEDSNLMSPGSFDSINW